MNSGIKKIEQKDNLLKVLNDELNNDKVYDEDSFEEEIDKTYDNVVNEYDVNDNNLRPIIKNRQRLIRRKIKKPTNKKRVFFEDTKYNDDSE